MQNNYSTHGVYKPTNITFGGTTLHPLKPEKQIPRVMNPIHSTVSSDGGFPWSIHFVLLDHYPVFFSDFQGEFTNLFLERKKIHTPKSLSWKNKDNLRCGLLRKTAFLGHLRLAVLVSQALFSICFVLNQSHMGAVVTIMVSKWLQKMVDTQHLWSMGMPGP